MSNAPPKVDTPVTFNDVAVVDVETILLIKYCSVPSPTLPSNSLLTNSTNYLHVQSILYQLSEHEQTYHDNFQLGRLPIAEYNDGILFSPACASITPPVTRIPERAVTIPTRINVLEHLHMLVLQQHLNYQ